MARAPRFRRRADDAGETLLELLVSIAILGIGSAAILGAVLMTVDYSMADRDRVQAQLTVRSWAEQLQSAVTDATWVDCATPTTYSASPFGYGIGASRLPALPAGFRATVASVEYWDGSTFARNCPASGDYGVQRVTLHMDITGTTVPVPPAEAVVVVRRPCTTPLSTTTC